MKQYVKSINDLILVLKDSHLPPMRGNELFEFNTSASLVIELAKKIQAGEIVEAKKEVVKKDPIKKAK